MTEATAPDTVSRVMPLRLLQGLVERESIFLVVILGVLVLGFTLLTPSGTFLGTTNFLNIALDTSEIVVLAGGMTFVIVAAGIDLSIGSLVVFSSVAFAEIMTHIAGTSGVLGGQARHLTLAIGCGVAISLVAGGGWGAFNGYLIGYRNIPAFVVTLGSLGMALGLAQVLTGGVNVSGVPYSSNELTTPFKRSTSRRMRPTFFSMTGSSRTRKRSSCAADEIPKSGFRSSRAIPADTSGFAPTRSEQASRRQHGPGSTCGDTRWPCTR